MKINGKRLMEFTEKLSFNRPTGTRQEKRASEIIMEEIRSAGVEPVYESYTFEDAEVLAAQLEILSPFSRKYEISVYKMCANTDEDGLTAPFYYGQNLSPADLKNCKDKIVLINGWLTAETYKKVIDAGAKALITMSGNFADSRESSDLFGRQLRRPMRAMGNIPTANIRTCDAFDIVKNGAETAKITIINRTVKSQSGNISATIKGTEYPEETVCFGAHYDSIDFGDGATDNAAGCAVTMEALRYFAENPPKRTVKFVFFGSEEVGLEGAKAYRRMHSDEMGRYVMMLNTDTVGNAMGYDIAAFMATKDIVSAADSFMQEKNYPVIVKQQMFSADAVIFADMNIPSVNFIRFGGNIHSHLDTVSQISEKSLCSTAKFVIDYGAEIANCEKLSFTPEVSEDMHTTIDKFLYKKELSQAGLEI